MRLALVNPTWSFDGSIYFGCREPHLPLELGAAKLLLERAGHEAEIFDGHLFAQPMEDLADHVADFRPDMTVVATAPSYLFWRCAPPELRVPREFLVLLGARGGQTVAIGPHGSATPRAALRKLGCNIVLQGEAEEALVELANNIGSPEGLSGFCYRSGEELILQGGPRATRFTDLPAIHWPNSWIARHHHHHHRFEAAPAGPGAEVESSRGCPYSCSFCAKIDFRDAYRRRDLGALLEEIDALVKQGVTYLYFIDEIFLPKRPLLEALRERPLQFGIQTRIDLWKPDMLELLGEAGCVSIEAGVESVTEVGRASLDKNCRMSTAELVDRLIYARKFVPFVQANLIKSGADSDDQVAFWRDKLRDASVWANDPVPLFAYPSSPDYHKLFGAPDDRAWERAHAHYLAQFDRWSDIQEEQPALLEVLEDTCCPT